MSTYNKDIILYSRFVCFFVGKKEFCGFVCLSNQTQSKT